MLFYVLDVQGPGQFCEAEGPSIMWAAPNSTSDPRIFPDQEKGVESYYGREGVAGEVEKGGAGVREQLDEGWLVAREGSAGSGEAGGRQLAATPQPVRPPPAQRLELSK